MNKLTIIGNLTRDPELRTTQQGLAVCDFTVAVNRRKSDESDFFRVTAWRQLGENAAKYLAKGRKVCVIGPVSARTYTTNTGENRVSLEVTADDIEFLTPRTQEDAYQRQERAAIQQEATGYTEVPNDGLPF